MGSAGTVDRLRDMSPIWREYIASRSDDLRKQLIEHYLPEVTRIALRKQAKLPRSVQLDDLVSAGTFGLIYAIGRYRLDKKTRFETYCQKRISGAITDYLRSCDVLTRQSRTRLASMIELTNDLRNRLGRAPTDEELRDAMNLSQQQFERVLHQSRACQTISLSRVRSSNEGTKDLLEMDTLEDCRSIPLIRQLQQKDLRQFVERGLKRSERLIVVLYYFERMTMKEIGATLGISESRVSQVHDEIMSKLRTRMNGREQEFVELAA